MANTAFFARHGISANGQTTISGANGQISVGANVVINTSALAIGSNIKIDNSYIQIPGVAGNYFKYGNADGASYSNHNIIFKGWWGMGMATWDDSVWGYYDFRSGTWDVKGGFKVNGSNAVINSSSVTVGNSTVFTSLGNYVDVRTAPAATSIDYLTLRPSDWGTNKPGLYFKQAAAKDWQINLWDGSSTAGNVTFNVSNLNIPGAIFSSGGWINLTTPTIVNYGVIGSSGTPELRFDKNAGANTNERYWRFIHDNRTFYFQTVNDAWTAVSDIFYATRNANSYIISGVVIPSTLTAGSYNTTSDKKLKTKVKNIETTKPDKVMALKFVDYSIKTEPDVRRTGFVAQDVEKIFPEYVHKDGKGNLTLDYNSIIMCFLKKVQEQEKRIKTLEERSG